MVAASLYLLAAPLAGSGLVDGVVASYALLAAVGAALYAAREYVTTVWRHLSAILVVRVQCEYTPASAICALVADSVIVSRPAHNYLFQPTVVDAARLEAHFTGVGRHLRGFDAVPLPFHSMPATLVCLTPLAAARVWPFSWFPRLRRVYWPAVVSYRYSDQIQIVTIRAPGVTTAFIEAVAERALMSLGAANGWSSRIIRHQGSALEPRTRNKSIFAQAHGSNPPPGAGGNSGPTEISRGLTLGVVGVLKHAVRDGDNAIQDGFVPTEAARRVRAALRFWYESREWYAARHVPWRIGLALVGAPGTGKTLAVTHAAHALGLPIHAIDLATFTNTELTQLWEQLAYGAPKIILLEDIDRLFDDAGQLRHEYLTLDCVLNLMDGAVPMRGVAVICTANEPRRCPAALFSETDAGFVTRPGRVDRVIQFGPMTSTERAELAAGILGADDPALPGILAEHTTPATITAACVDVARIRLMAEEGCVTDGDS